MKDLDFTELTLIEQENLSGGHHKRNWLPIIQQGNVAIIQQQANSTAYAIGPNSIAIANASNYAVAGQTNQVF